MKHAHWACTLLPLYLHTYTNYMHVLLHEQITLTHTRTHTRRLHASRAYFFVTKQSVLQIPLDARGPGDTRQCPNMCTGTHTCIAHTHTNDHIRIHAYHIHHARIHTHARREQKQHTLQSMCCGGIIMHTRNSHQVLVRRLSGCKKH